MAPITLDKDTERLIDEAYRDAQGPIPLRTQTESYVVISVSDFASLGHTLTKEEKQSLAAGLEDMKTGRTKPLSSVLDDLGSKYAL